MACYCGGNQVHGRQPSGGCYCVCACASSGFPAGSHPPIPNPAPNVANDPLLLALVARLLHPPPAAAAPSPPSYQFCHEEYQGFQFPSQQRGQQRRDHQHQYQQHQHERQQQPQPQAQSLIRSLLRRIAALESAIPGAASPRGRPAPRRALLRDLAARTIQAAFRRYLVRRSRILRDLKHLASIRSHLAALRSSLSDETRISPKALYQRVVDLLHQLDSIWSADVMIREGKKPISRELVLLLEFAESLMVQKREVGVEAMEISRRRIDQGTFSGKGRAGFEDLPDLFEVPVEEAEESDEGSPNIGASTTNTAKRTTFEESVKGSRVSTIAGESIIEEERSRLSAGGRAPRGAGVVSQEDVIRWNSYRFVPEEAAGRDDGVSNFFPLSDDFVDVPRLSGGGGGGDNLPGRSGSPADQDGPSSSGLSAPLPLQMEPRKGNTKKMTVTVI
ncbi:unnamed protein product [Spirodela intermedia]|uniref:Uncharacterized protein n=1 Tax=Spirodela intermedia TaxID=51605 RepID=A0A7I8IJ97_SPIIN|nr:unnamed protein product [Spirodela intermedia]CAA6657419.1 unnamed protein product [Spirodela intermedia]